MALSSQELEPPTNPGRFIPTYDIRPEGEREEYTAIVFLEPFDERNRKAFGYDMFSEQVRRSAMERARDTGEGALSGKVELVQEITENKQAGFLLYLPVYASGHFPEDVAARRETLFGYVYSPFRAGDLMHGILQNDFPEIGLEIFDGSEAADGMRLYHEEGWLSSAANGPPAALTRMITIDIAGRPWTFVFWSTPSLLSGGVVSGANAILIGGLLASILLFGVVWTLGSTRHQALRLAEGMVRERESSEAKFRELFSSSHDSIVLVGADGVISDINTQAETTFGYSRDELIGQSIEALMPEATGGAHVGWRENYVANPSHRMMGAGDLDLKGRRKDGTMFRADISLTPLLSGAAPIVAAGVRDLTQKLAIEAQLLQAQKMESVGQLTGGIAHDFNNLIGVIVGNLDLLSDRLKGDDEAEELAGSALEAALRGADLTRQLLAFARRQQLKPEQIDVNDLVTRIGRLLRRAITGNIEIVVDLGDQVWPVIVDASQLETSLINLANNARDAMPDGGTLTISTSNECLDEEYAALHLGLEAGDFAMIEVSDDGTGMPPEIASEIFDPFFTTKEQGKGTGLGLSMVFGFMKQSNGHINLYSEEGVGTTFRLYLPRDGTTAAVAGTPTVVAPTIGGGETILVVEDDPGMRRIVMRQLRELGYRLIEAEHAPAALEILERETVDLLFTDIIMPKGMSGYDLARAVSSRWPATRVLLTSGFTEKAHSGNGEKLIDVDLSP